MRYGYLFIMFCLSLLLSACATPQTSSWGVQPGLTGLSKQDVLQRQAVFFAQGRKKLSAAAVAVLQLHAKYLNQHPEQVILLAANTDIHGSREYNIAIGAKRNTEIANWLMASGVAANQIQRVSYGAEVPLACGATDEDIALNRRVDILYCQTDSCEKVAKHYAQNLCTYTQ